MLLLHTYAKYGSVGRKKWPQNGRNPRVYEYNMKQDLRYWQARLFKEARGGHTHVDDNYSVRIAHAGRRERFQLGTANKYEAAAKARAIYLALVANGWDLTLARFKTAKAPVKVDVTIGEFLAELRALHASKARTLEG